MNADLLEACAKLCRWEFDAGFGWWGHIDNCAVLFALSRMRCYIGPGITSLQPPRILVQGIFAVEDALLHAGWSLQMTSNKMREVYQYGDLWISDHTAPCYSWSTLINQSIKWVIYPDRATAAAMAAKAELERNRNSRIPK